MPDTVLVQVTGELTIRAYNAATWKFPEFHGRIAVRCVCGCGFVRRVCVEGVGVGGLPGMYE